MTSNTARVSTALHVPESAVRDHHPGELVVDVHPDAIPELAERVSQQLGGRLLSLFATDDRARAGAFGVHQVWSLPRLQAFLRLSASIDPAAP
jgi:Ni,Fe-hydrogenase III component G